MLGGQYAWMPARPGARPTVHCFGPDELAWQELEQGYADWLYAVLVGSLTRFYDTLRWPGWQPEVAAVDLGQGISCYPPPWSAEGHHSAVVSRRVVPLADLVSYYQATADQFGPGDEAVVAAVTHPPCTDAVTWSSRVTYAHGRGSARTPLTYLVVDVGD